MSDRPDFDLLADKAKLVRTETVRLTRIAGSGHYGSAFSIAELLASLYYHHLRLRPDEPSWPDRDRFLLGKGHAAIGLYPILADLGYFDRSWLDSYTRLGSPLGDHPDRNKVPGCDFSSGSIGHNLSVGVGMALAARVQRSPARVVCLMGDGEQAEGQVWEAAGAAAAYGLGNLVGIIDRNRVGSDGATAEVLDLEPLADKWAAFGWDVRHLPDGHDLEHVDRVLGEAFEAGGERPVLVLADTIAGKGVSFMEGTWQWHLGYLGPTDYERAMSELEAQR